MIQAPGDAVLIFGLQQEVTAYHIEVGIGQSGIFVVYLRHKLTKGIVVPRSLGVRVVGEDIQLLFRFLVHINHIDADAVVILFGVGIVLLKLVHDGEALVSAHYSEAGTFVHDYASHKPELLDAAL